LQGIKNVKPHDTSTFPTKLFSGYRFPCAEKKNIINKGIVANSEIRFRGSY